MLVLLMVAALSIWSSLVAAVVEKTNQETVVAVVVLVVIELMFLQVLRHPYTIQQHFFLLV
tara:strand:+ start:179 stop:361 length:183 start_codon:yes stop_codon:yes gene_type:complete